MAAAEGPKLSAQPVPLSRLRAIGDEGWLNAWSGHVGLPLKTVQRFRDEGDPTVLGREEEARAVCSRDGWVTPRRPGEGSRSAAAVLRGVVFSDAPRDLVLRASTTGTVTIAAFGQRVEVEEMPGREGRALPDERFYSVHLGPGNNDISVIVEPETAGLQLRLREPDGRPARGLLYAERIASASCRPADLIDAAARLDVTPAGLTLAMTPRLRGLIPDLPREIPVEVTTSSGRSREPAARASLIGLVAKPETISIVLPAADKGRPTVDVAMAGGSVHVARLTASGALVARVAKLAELAARVAGSQDLPEGTRESFAHHVETLGGAVARGEPDVAWLTRHTERAEALGKKLDRGVDAYAEERGVVFRAYRSALDGKRQPYVAFVPKSLDRRGPLPLVLVSHGKDRLPEHALRTLVGEAPDEHMTLAFAAHNLPRMDDKGAIYAAPWGFGNAGPRAVGEEDMLAVIRDIQAAYRVDPRRVSLTGYSLGGTVSFVLPLHFPDVFSAAAPLCGYPNLLSYQSVAKVPHLPWEDTLLAKEYIVRYAENGLHVPLDIVHGGKDGPGRSKVVADRYAELGYAHVFDVQEELDHNVWDYAYEDGKMIPRLTRHAAPRAPKRVRLVTGRYRYDRAYWLRLVGMIDCCRAEPASLDASFEDKEGRVRVTTRNVAAFEIDPARLGDSLPARLTVEVDGTTLEAEPTAPILFVRGDDGRFASGASGDALPFGKRRGLSGPLDDVEHGPVTIVYGAADPAMTEANRMVAEHLATLGDTAEIAYPVFSDEAVTDADLEGRSVILVGTPAQNRLTAAVAPQLPATFEPSAIVLRGQRHEGPDLAASFIFPGPEGFSGDALTRRGSRYVVVHAGTSPRAALAVRFLPRYLPDYVVYDASLAVRRGGLLMDGRPVRAAGFFDESWR